METGPLDSENNLKPDCLISLTAPKLCAQFFQGQYHFLGNLTLYMYIYDGFFM